MKNKKNIIFYSVLVLLLILSVVIYQITTKAAYNDTDSDNATVATAKILGIKTGSGDFDSSDSYQIDSNFEVTGYDAGNDASDDNRIVRSFDSVLYNLQVSIKPKEGRVVSSTRNVEIVVSLDDNEASYVSFDPTGVTGITSKSYIIERLGINNLKNIEIPLYVVNAPNNATITPSFTIKETTDTSPAVVIGKNGSNIYYSYDGNYNIASSFDDHKVNIMPTYVSSNQSKGSLNIITYPDYNGQNTSEGRYFTEVVELSTNNVKGAYYNDSATYSYNVSSTGGELVQSDDWIRLYSPQNIEAINPVVVDTAYSTGEDKTGSNETRNPGSVSVSGDSITFSNFKIPYIGPTVAASSASLGDKKVIGTYAITVYSRRLETDGQSPISVTMNVGGLTNTFTGDYNSTQDYGLVSGFYDAGGESRLTQRVDNGIPLREDINSSTSKGSTIIYKTNFNYKQTGSTTGLKEVLKFDENAFRVMPYEDDKDIGIKITCGDKACEGIDDNSFEYKFITGSWDPENYEKTEVDSRVTESYVAGQCANLSIGNKDQMMNVYGSPCIKGKEGIESTFDNIKDAKTEKKKEIPITKVIVQTKEGVALPSEANITVYVKLRVRNVGDLTRTYQATTVVSTSDYDSVLRYYSPELKDDATASTNILNPNNYTRSELIGDRVIPTANMDQPYGDSIRIVNFTARQDITVTNTQNDGQSKTSFSVDENETIQYRIKSYIIDNNIEIGADDTWYIKNAAINVTIDANLDYIEDDSLGTPAVTHNQDGTTTLTYIIPWTKPNGKINDIYFNTKLKSTITGTGVPIVVVSKLDPININGERDYSEVDAKEARYTIYGTYSPTVLLSQENIGGTIVDRNQEFSYLLKAYNNTGEEVRDFTILDILPYNNDNRKTNIDGSYEVKVELPASQNGAKVYCSTMDPKTLSGDIDNSNDSFTECAAGTYNSASAIKISGINIGYSVSDENVKNMEPIKVTLKPTDNKFGNKYVNSFKGAYKRLTPKTSNKIEYKVISRTIKGRVFYDYDEDGVRQDEEKLVSGIPVTLYKLGSNGLENAGEATTNENGEYAFTALEAGYYKVRFKFDGSKYDLALRYGTEDVSRDSDAYKISDNEAEITHRYNPDEIDGINLTLFEDSKKEDMDMGLIPRSSFGFEVKKFITQVDLNYNNTLTSNKYENQSEVALNVRNTLSSNAKVYYGIQVTNNSTKSGYVKLLEETIPNGMIYNGDDPYNAEWHIVDGVIQSNKYQDKVVKPGESIYLQIAMEMPSRSEAGTFINRVTLLNVEQYDSELGEEAMQYSKGYNVGDSVTYANKDWYVLSVGNIISLDQALVELNYTADEYNSNDNIRQEVDSYINGNEELDLILANSVASKAHNTSGIYKWSTSEINNYINNEWANSSTSLNTPILKDQVICDDPSSTTDESYGGSLITEGGNCLSNVYVTSKIRLLTIGDYEKAKGLNLQNYNWLYGDGSFWLTNGYHKAKTFDIYGNQTNTADNNMASYIELNASDNPKSGSATQQLQVRPVITVSSKHIISN